MYKKKKLLLNIINILFLIFSLIELIKYFKIDNTLYGVIYLLINLVIIFLLLPVTFNYKRHYSTARISKILNLIVLKSMNYTDGSNDYIKSIFIFKNILKPILYLLLSGFLILESKSQYKLKKISKND